MPLTPLPGFSPASRQKLLEASLTEVDPRTTVHRWPADEEEVQSEILRDNSLDMSIFQFPHKRIIDLHHGTTVRGGSSDSQTLCSVSVGVNEVSVGRLWGRIGVGVPTIRFTRVGSEDDLGSTFGLRICDKRTTIQLRLRVADGYERRLTKPYNTLLKCALTWKGKTEPSITRRLSTPYCEHRWRI